MREGTGTSPLEAMFVSSKLESKSLSFFRYPLFLVSCSLVGGFLFQHFFTLSFQMWFVLLVVSFAVQLLWYRHSAFFFMVLGFWVLVGVGIHFWSFDYPREGFQSWDRRTVSVTGYVVEKDERYFLSRIDGFPVYSPVLLLRGEDLGKLAYSRVNVRGLFRKFTSCANPGGVDLRLQWWKERVMGYLEVKEVRGLPERSVWFSLLRWVREQEKRFLSLWQQDIGENGSLFAALFLGKRDPHFFAEKPLFERMGIYHLFCVSGFHLTSLGSMFLVVFRRFGVPEKWTFLVWGFWSFFYLLFCGLVPSAFRAFLMLSLYLWGKRLGRRVVSVGILWAAFLIMVVLQPEIILDSGAQLSFAATGGLVVLWRFFELRGQEANFLVRKVKEHFFLGLSVYAVSFPFLLGHGFSFSSLFLLGNFLCLPLVQGTLFLAFWGTPFLFVSPVRRLLAVVLRGLLELLSFVSRFLVEHVPHLFLRFARWPDFLVGVGIFLGMWVFIALVLFRGKVRMVVCCVLLLMFLPFFFVLPTDEFWVFDVGQGLACGVLAESRISFIDVGGVIRGYGLTGRSILERFLDYRGIERVDKVFLTHWHKDHVAGLEIVTPDTAILAPHNSDQRSIPFLPVTTPAHIRLDNGVIVQIFPVHGKSLNDQALVYRVNFGGMRILLTGDIEEEGINLLMGYGKNNLAADVVVLPHHGKYYPNLAAFLRQVGCHTVIISCGENDYGHPDRRTLDLVREMGLRCFVTRDDGAVRVWNSRGGWKVKSVGKRDL